MVQVSRDQISRAKEVDILDYLMTHEPDNLKRQGHGRYTLRDHDSFVISNGKWVWNSRRIGCKTGTALNYLIEVRGIRFVDAVRLLAGDETIPIPKKAKAPPEKRAPFQLPPRNKDNIRITAYLQSRGISKDVIEDCINAGILYESAVTHYCVFTGKNAEGKTRFACYRSTSGRYRQDEEGSDKRCGFILPPLGKESKTLAIFESPVDALSHKSLCLDGYIQWDGWRLSLSGSSLHALEYFLEHNPNITDCFVCTDNDDAGNIMAEKIRGLLRSEKRFSSMSVTRAPPTSGKDYNDMLCTIRRQERTTSVCQKADKSL